MIVQYGKGARLVSTAGVAEYGRSVEEEGECACGQPGAGGVRSQSAAAQ